MFPDSVMTLEERERVISVLSDACRRIGKERCTVRKGAEATITTTKFAAAIEHGIAVWSEAKSKSYRRKLYSILWAMRNDSHLFSRYDPWDLAYVKEDLLLPVSHSTAEPHTHAHDHSAADDETISALEKMLKERLRCLEVKVRACPKCGSTELERIALQLRSADEGMTQMMQCTSCNHRFK
jgi:DNA-directed RNA polymerase subunit M/transcription elongation factor TFIIS